MNFKYDNGFEKVFSGTKEKSMGLGSMTFGLETEPREALAMLDFFHASGGIFLDTADVYTDGEAERIIGQWFSSRKLRQEVFLSTKSRFSKDPSFRGASYAAVMKSTEASLKRLKTDYIVLFFIHGWDQQVPVEETLRALSDLKAQGKIRFYGWSNLAGWQLERVISTARALAMDLRAAVQVKYNLMERGIELELMPCCIENGVAVLPWSPLAGGWLTGKYRQNQSPTGATRLGENPERGVEAYGKRNVQKTIAILSLLDEIAKAHHITMAQCALLWLVSRHSVPCVVLGARTLAQLKTNLDAVDHGLEQNVIERLTQISQPECPAYPYSFLQEWSDMSCWRDLNCF